MTPLGTTTTLLKYEVTSRLVLNTQFCWTSTVPIMEFGLRLETAPVLPDWLRWSKGKELQVVRIRREERLHRYPYSSSETHTFRNWSITWSCRPKENLAPRILRHPLRPTALFIA